MTLLQTIFAAFGYELRINENFRAVAPAGIYAFKPESANLTVELYGGIFNKNVVLDYSATVAASATYYFVAANSTGAITYATSTTNWNDPTNYTRLGVFVAGTLTGVWTDHREVLGGGGGGGGGSGDVVGPASSVSGRVATFSGTTGKVIQDGGVALSALATVAYVDALLAGLSWKQSVRAATTANGTLASAYENGDTVDGVVLATGNRILIKNQTTASENGIYVVNASGAPTRATDADMGAELVSASVFVQEGTANAETQWVCSTDAPITVGSTSVAFVQLNAGGGATWGAIVGTLSSQADLQTALDLKQNRSPNIQSVASSGTVTPTFSNDAVKITAQAAPLTLANPTGTAIDMAGMVIRIKDNGTARAISYGAQYRALGVTLPVTTLISKTLYLAMVYNADDTKWDVVAVGQEP